MLCTNGKSDSGRLDALLSKLFFVELRVCGGSGVDSKTLNIGNVCQEGEYLKIINELLSIVLSALDLKGEDRAAAVGEVLVIKLLLLACCK